MGHCHVSSGYEPKNLDLVVALDLSTLAVVMAWLPMKQPIPASRLDDQSVKDMNVFVLQNICIQIIVSQKLRFSS